jgi:O-antigen/teichoic acid export membrane protein
MIRQFKLSRFYNKHMLVLFGNGVQMVVGFATSFVLFHYLSVEAAGMWYFIQTFVALCESARYGFFATATVKFYAGTETERARTVLGSVWFLALIMTLIILSLNAIGLLYLPHTNDIEMILCIKWIGITYLSSLPADVVFWRLQADEKYGKMFLYRMVNSLSTIIVFIVLIYLHKFTLENALIYNFFTNCFCSLLGIVLNMSGIKYIFNRSRECIREIFHFGKFTFGTTMLSTTLGSSDTWIINAMLGPAAVAVYNLAMRFMGLIDMPLRSFITTGMSEMAISQNSKNTHQLVYIFKKYAGMLTIAFIPFTIVAFIGGGFAIKIMGGHNYDGGPILMAINAFGLMLILSIFYPIERFNGLALDIIHRTRTNFQKVVLMLAVKIAAGLIFTMFLKNIFVVVLG